MRFQIRPLATLLGVTTAMLVSGCATSEVAPASDPLAVKPAPKTADAKVTTEYEYVKVTGSLVPMKVPKNGGKPLPNSAPVTNMSAENFDAVVQKGLRDSPGKN